MKNELREIANQIIELEKSNFINDDARTKEMEKIIANLKFGELMEIDDYIIKNQYLQK